MEHVLHTFFALLFCLAAAGCITAQAVPTGRRTVVPLVVLAVLLVATRYEGAFLVAAAFALLCLRRRFGAAALVAVAGAAPAVAHGLVSTAHGELFLPNSVLLKTATGAAGVAGLLSNLYDNVVTGAPCLLRLGLAGGAIGSRYCSC